MTSPALIESLRTFPGRCPECAFHIESMGHRRSCSQADVGHRRAAAGMARAEAAHPGDVAIVEAAIDAACASGRPFSANDFRHLCDDLEQPNVIGARIRARATSKRIKRIGDEPSSLPNTNGHRIGVYVPADPQTAGTTSPSRRRPG